MPVPILDTAFVGRLNKRLKIGGAVPSLVALGDIVVMTVSIDELLEVKKNARVVADISAGNITIATVPAGKRWLVRYVESAGTSYLRVMDAAGGVVANFYSSAAGAQRWFGQLGMDQGQFIQLLQGLGGDTAVTVYVVYEEEDAY